MALPQNFEWHWEQANSDGAFDLLLPGLKAYLSEYCDETRDQVEDAILGLLKRSGTAGQIHILTAVLCLSPLDLKNNDLVQNILRYLDNPSPEVRIAAIHVIGRMASEHRDTPGTFLSHIMRRLESEWNVQCRDRTLVYAETSVCKIQKQLAEICLGTTADTKLGPWREMFVLDAISTNFASWRDWSSFLDTLLAKLHELDELAWMAFNGLVGSSSQHSSLYRELVERLPELFRIAAIVEEKQPRTTNLTTRYVLTELLGALSRRRKKKLLSENMEFFVETIKYDDPGIWTHCLELFAELSIVPLLSRERRRHLLTHEDDMVRELAEELFLDDSESPE